MIDWFDGEKSRSGFWRFAERGGFYQRESPEWSAINKKNPRQGVLFDYMCPNCKVIVAKLSPILDEYSKLLIGHKCEPVTA